MQNCKIWQKINASDCNQTVTQAFCILMLKYSLYESTYFFRKEPIFLCSSQPIIECRSNTLKWEPSANYNMFDHFWWNKKVLPWNCPSSFHNIFCHVFLKAKCSRNNIFLSSYPPQNLSYILCTNINTVCLK